MSRPDENALEIPNDNQNAFTVLWAEDELIEEARIVMAERLKQRGLGEVNVVPAQHMKAAEAAFERMSDCPLHLVILDLMLPRDEKASGAIPPRVDMNAGYLLWYSMRKLTEQDDPIRRVPLVVLTARVNPEFRSAMEEDENLLWLSKPISAEELGDAIVAQFVAKSLPNGDANA